jgi:hypothetical protein
MTLSARTDVQIKRATRVMKRRWEADLARLEQIFGPYGPGGFTDGAEMQRNLGSAICAAQSLLARAAGELK